MATTMTQTETFVGKRVRRREDPRLITGTATYVEDIQMPGMHYAVIVRSPHAAARIRSIKTKQAEAAPGVVAVYTGKDTPRGWAVPCGTTLPGIRDPHHPLFATGRGHFVWHPLAGAGSKEPFLAPEARD